MNRSSRSGSAEPRTSDRGKELDKGDNKNNKSPQNSRSNSRRRSAERRSRSASLGNKGNVLYVGNLARNVDENDVRDHFEKYGRITDINIVKDPYTRECRGFAFIKYDNPQDATDALDMDNKDILGRRIRVEKSKRERGHEKTPGEYLGHDRSRRRRRSPSPYRRRSPRGRRSRDRNSRDRSDNRRYRDHDRDRHRSRSRDKYRSRSRDRSGSYSRRRR